MNRRSSIQTALATPHLSHPGEIQVGVFSDDTGPARTCRSLEFGRNDDAQCPRCRQLLPIPGIADKTQLARLRRSQGAKSTQNGVAVAVQYAPQGIDNISEGQRHTNTASNGYLTPAFSALITLSVMSCLGLI